MTTETHHLSVSGIRGGAGTRLDIMNLHLGSIRSWSGFKVAPLVIDDEAVRLAAIDSWNSDQTPDCQFCRTQSLSV